jgi:hypothetical protein
VDVEVGDARVRVELPVVVADSVSVEEDSEVVVLVSLLEEERVEVRVFVPVEVGSAVAVPVVPSMEKRSEKLYSSGSWSEMIWRV